MYFELFEVWNLLTSMLEKEKTSSSLEKRGIASVLLSVGLLKEQIAE